MGKLTHTHHHGERNFSHRESDKWLKKELGYRPPHHPLHCPKPMDLYLPVSFHRLSQNDTLLWLSDKCRLDKASDFAIESAPSVTDREKHGAEQMYTTIVHQRCQAWTFIVWQCCGQAAASHGTRQRRSVVLPRQCRLTARQL